DGASGQGILAGKGSALALDRHCAHHRGSRLCRQRAFAHPFGPWASQKAEHPGDPGHSRCAEAYAERRMSALSTWAGIGCIVVTATTGDILQARAMKEIGDLGALRHTRGLFTVVRRVVSSSRFMLGLLFMALAFFSLLVTLSWDDVSVVGPASASLTFVAN